MADLQVKNIPDALYERLRRHARANNTTVNAAVLTAIKREINRWDWRDGLAQRPETDLRGSAASLLDEARRQREAELDRRSST